VDVLFSFLQEEACVLSVMRVRVRQQSTRHEHESL
jgi:hypothetical protein